MERRKLQLIAGTTYTVSLPKSWVAKNHLKAGNEVILNETADNTIRVAATVLKEKKLSEISIDVDDYPEKISQILFSIYYMGIENITLFSKKELDKDVKSKIRRTLSYMSGTEIQYEDKQKITIKVLLDKSKVDLIQVIQRIYFIIDSSLANIAENLDIDEIKLNENEVDRLYHLTAKIISLSLVNPEILQSSNIKDISLVNHYFMISKRLENIADDIEHLAESLKKSKRESPYLKKTIDFIRKELRKSIFAIKNSKMLPPSVSDKELAEIRLHLAKIKEPLIVKHLEDAVRHLIDIDEEIGYVLFYNRLTSRQA